MFPKILEILKHIPVVNLVPILDSIVTELPNAWNAIPSEKKQEYLTNFIAAGAKAAGQYASK